MSRRNRNRTPPFVALTWGTLNSAAYKALTHSAKGALPYFLGKYKGAYSDSSRYTFEFHFSYSEANRYGFASATFSKIIQDLVSKGFIDPADKGGLRGDGKSYNLFKLSHRWESFGKPDFKVLDWKCFCPRDRKRLKATSKSETYSFKNGNRSGQKGVIISPSEAVGGN